MVSEDLSEIKAFFEKNGFTVVATINVDGKVGSFRAVSNDPLLAKAGRSSGASWDPPKKKEEEGE